MPPTQITTLSISNATMSRIISLICQKLCLIIEHNPVTIKEHNTVTLIECNTVITIRVALFKHSNKRNGNSSHKHSYLSVDRETSLISLQQSKCVFRGKY